MLYTLAVVLLWLLGLVSSYTLSGFIHLLLVIAILVVLLRAARRSDQMGSPDDYRLYAHTRLLAASCSPSLGQ